MVRKLFHGTQRSNRRRKMHFFILFRDSSAVKRCKCYREWRPIELRVRWKEGVVFRERMNSGRLAVLVVVAVSLSRFE